MPQIMALAFIGAGLYAGYRWVKGAASAVAEEITSKSQTAASEKDLGSLEFDPKSGVYKPVDRE
jgi:hypothetical protein